MNIVKNKLVNMPEEGNRLRFVLVYQAGIANLFKVDCFNLTPYGRNATRVYQGTFSQAECIAHGVGLAGAIVHSLACNEAGDITESIWSSDLDNQPFSKNFHPVFYTRGL